MYDACQNQSNQNAFNYCLPKRLSLWILLYLYHSVPPLTLYVHSFADSLIVFNKSLFSTYYMLCPILRPGDTVKDRAWSLHSKGGQDVLVII